MKTFEYQNMLRVTVGELTRAQQLELWRDSEWARSESGIARQEVLADMITVSSTFKIDVRKGSKWQPVTDATTVDINGREVEVSVPMTVAAYHALPMSLTNQWAKEAMLVNGDMAQVLFLASASQRATQNGSEPVSEDEP